MWILCRIGNDDKVYLLCDKPSYTVGRNENCDIVGEPTLKTLGRLHASLHPYENHVELVDTESKSGTQVNPEKEFYFVDIKPCTWYSLKAGDTIKFGFGDFKWKLEKIKIVVLSTTLGGSEKEDLSKHISALGGRTINQWSNTCTYLVVKNLTFTVEVLQALCHAIPIVNPEFFEAMLSAARSNGTLPTVDNFQPLIVDRLISNSELLQVNVNRKSLFAGKILIFMKSEDMETFRGIVECARGTCSSLDTHQWQRRHLVKPKCIVINSTSGETQSQADTQLVDELSDFLRSKGCRMVPDSEITLAILHCSLEKFCNPKLEDTFENDTRLVSTTSNALVYRNEIVPIDSINVFEIIEQPNSTTLSADLAMFSEERSKGKGQISTDGNEPSTKNA